MYFLIFLFYLTKFTHHLIAVETHWSDSGQPHRVVVTRCWTRVGGRRVVALSSLKDGHDINKWFSLGWDMSSWSFSHFLETFLSKKRARLFSNNKDVLLCCWLFSPSTFLSLFRPTIFDFDSPSLTAPAWKPRPGGVGGREDRTEGRGKVETFFD